MRRNLSGIYIFDKFDGEDKKTPTCFEDCQEHTQDIWLESLEREALISLAKQLAGSLKTIGNLLDLEA
jgi:hypothetical protein